MEASACRTRNSAPCSKTSIRVFAPCRRPRKWPSKRDSTWRHSLTIAPGDGEQIQTALARFDYVHKGSLAYIGKDAAVADIPGFAIVKGIAAGLIWKSFETISQVSPCNALLAVGRPTW